MRGLLLFLCLCCLPGEDVLFEARFILFDPSLVYKKESMKKTVGAIASELKQSDNALINPQEIQKATEKEYLDNLVWAVKHAKKQVPCETAECKEICDKRTSMDGDFYIVGILKKERLLDNVLRNYFIPTLACPTPPL